MEVLREYYDHKGPAGKFCGFFSIAFNPSSDDPRLLGSALATSDIRSFYLAPEFQVLDGEDDRLSEIMDAVIENEHITTLGLWQRHFSDNSVNLVARVLANNQRITSLSIENTKDLTHVGISGLAATLGSSKVRTLSLRIPPQAQDPEEIHRFDNALGKFFTAAIRTSDQLRSLTLAPTDMLADLRGGTAGNLSGSADALGQALVANAGSLISIDITGLQAWGDGEMNNLMHSLAWRGGDHTLNRLAFTNTSISDLGANAVAGFLKSTVAMSVLNTIELDYSNIGDPGVQAIALAIKHQSKSPSKNQLRHLSLVNAPISTDGAISLLDAIRHNRQMRKGLCALPSRCPMRMVMLRYPQVWTLDLG